MKLNHNIPKQVAGDLLDLKCIYSQIKYFNITGIKDIKKMATWSKIANKAAE